MDELKKLDFKFNHELFSVKDNSNEIKLVFRRDEDKSILSCGFLNNKYIDIYLNNKYAGYIRYSVDGLDAYIEYIDIKECYKNLNIEHYSILIFKYIADMLELKYIENKK